MEFKQPLADGCDWIDSRITVRNNIHFPGYRWLIVGAYLLGVAPFSALAQVRPVTGISAHYDSIDHTNDNYTVAGGGTGAYPSGNNYQIQFNVGVQNNLIIDGFETGTNVFNYIQLAQQINIIRINGAVTGQHNIVFFEEETISGTNVDLKPSLVTTMINSLRSDLVNRGADNVFANQGDGNGNNNNIERIDYVFNAGFPYYNFTDQRGFLVMDRGGNDRFKIAVILAVNSNGMPTAFSRPVSVSDADWGSSGITLDTTVMRGYTEDGQPLKPSARTSTQPLSGVFLSWDQFGLTTNDMVYGYSLAGNDVTTNGAYWTQVTNSAYFPTNTTVDSNFGGLDLISGGAMFFDEVLEVGIGDRVWEDYNGNGVQDAVEPGLSNVLVHIYTSSNVLAATARSDETGWYFAQGMGPGTYYLQFFPPDGYTFSPQEGTHDSELDSDPDSLSGITASYVMSSGQTNLSADAGLFLTPGDLSLNKTVSPTNVNVGEEVVFTLSITNLGTPNTAWIQVTDALPPAFGFSGYAASTGTFSDATGIWNVGSLPPGGGASLSITGTVHAGSGGSVVTNRATITRMNRPDTNETDNTASAVFSIESADLSVTKSSDVSALEETEEVLFTVSVTNLGPSDVTGVEVDDLLPTGFTFLTATPGQGSYHDGTGVWTVGALPLGAGATLDINATAALGSGGTILTNRASIGASSHEDPNSANDEADVSVLIYGADLQIDKTVRPLAAIEGQTVVYTLVVTNSGPTNATGVLVYEPLTNGLAFASYVASQGTYSDISGMWDLGSLSLNSSATLRISATVVEGTMDTTITNRSLITHTDWPDPDSENDEDTALLSVSSLVLTKASDVTNTVHPGETVTYTVVASNAGSAAHSGVTLLDAVPEGTTYVPDSLSVFQDPASSTTVVYSSSSTFMAPAGVTSVTVEAWGGGAGGGRARGYYATGGGGAGGAYAKKTLAVTPLQTYTVTVGTGGIGGNGTGTDTQHGRPGNPSWFDSTNTVFAEGGDRGLSDGRVNYSNGDPGTGSSANSIGDTVYAGGDGSRGNYAYSSGYSGAGGGGAGTTGNGGDALYGSGGSGTSLYGGDGADGVGNNSTGDNGSTYGGGGSGGKANSTTDRNGGSGADGLVRISYSSSGDFNDPPNLASGWTLDPGQILQATFSVLVDDPLALMAITNTATASSDLQLVPVSATVVDAVIQVDLAITKTASTSDLEEGDPLVFTLTVTNQSLLEAATGVAVDDLIPAGFDLDSATPSQGTYNPTTGVWTIGSIPAASVATLTMNVTAATGGGGFWWTNTASLTAYDQVDPVLTDNTAQAVVLIEGADLALTKTVDNPTPNETSEVVYTLQLTNSGPSDVTGGAVSEPLTNGLTYVSAVPSQGSYASGAGLWSVGTLTVGSTATLTLTAQVDAGTFGTILTNHSLISTADLPDPVTANNEDEASVVISGLNVAKMSDVIGYASPGDTLTYTIVVSNLSSIPHTGIDLEDVLPAGTIYVADSTWISGPGLVEEAGDDPPMIATNRTLAAGETLTVTFDALVVNPGSTTQLLNTVSVTCDQQPAPVEAWVADGVLHTDLELTKAVGDAHPDEGDTVVYTIIVTNLGPTNAMGILVSEPLTNGLTYVSHSAGQGTYNSTSGIWTVGTIQMGSSAQLQISATVDAGTSGTSITNQARISAADMADLVTANNSDTGVIQVVRVDVGIGKTAAPMAPAESGRVVYTITLTNQGPDTATGVEVTDVLPFGLVYLSHAAGQGAYDNGTGVWSAGSLESMQTAVLILTAVVQTNTVGTSITNTASITAVDQMDSDSGNDSAQVVVTPSEALLAITKTAEPAGPVWAGDVITYTLAVTNRSGVMQTNVTVTDPLPTGTVYVADSCQVNAPVTVEETFGDQFSRRVYSNDDGTENWAGDWVEGENNGPTAGYIQIQFDNGVDETYTLRFTGGNQSITRAADLSAYRSAILEFDYQRIGLDSTNEYVAIQVSSNGTAWTEVGRFRGSVNDEDYIHFTTNITAFISASTRIRFISPSGMDGTDIVWIDDVLITGTRRANLTVPGNSPPILFTEGTLEPDEYMSIQFEVWVDNPAVITQIVNRALLMSFQMPDPQIDTAVTPVESCMTAAPTGLVANPTNVTSFIARWDEVSGAFGYRLDVSTNAAFGPGDYVSAWSNRAVPGTIQTVTGLLHDVTYYFRVRAEWDSVCISANSHTQTVTTLGLPGIGVFPEALDFGVVDVNASSNLTLTVTNSGTAALDVSSIVLTGGGSVFLSVLPATALIASSNSVELTVTYAPTVGGTNEMRMTLNNDSLDFPELEVPVRGECFDPAAQLPELLDYWVTDNSLLINEVTDRSLGGGMASVSFTVYHNTGMTMEGASFDLLNPDGSVAVSNASFSGIAPVSVGGRASQELTATIPSFFPAILGDYALRLTVASSNGIWMTNETEFTSIAAGEAVPRILDTFSRTDVANDIGDSWLSNLTGPVSGNIQIRNRVLQFYGPGGTGGTNGRLSIVRNLSSQYDPVLTNNAGTLTWAFNFYSGRTNQLGFAPGAYGAAFILGSDSTDWVSGTGNGYAVRICSNQVALSSFTGGLNLDTDLTTIGTPASLSSATASVAVQVSLDAETGVWRLYVNELSGSGIGAFGNPLDNMESHLVTQVTNTFHLHRSLAYVGCYWNHGSAAVDADTAAFFDDLYAPFILLPSEAMHVSAIDNDIMMPTSLGNVLVNGEAVPDEVPDRFGVVWTNAPEFIVTFDPLATDQDPGYSIRPIQRDVRGIGEYRVSPDPVNVLSASNRGTRGLPFPVITTNGALANYGFEIISSGGDWVFSPECSYQHRSSDPSRVYEGTNSLRQTVGGTAIQTFEFRNIDGVIPQVELSGWYQGGSAGVSISAYSTNDLINPVETVTLSPAQMSEWTSFSLPEQALGDSTIEFLKVSLTAAGGETYWDNLRFSVNIGTNCSSMRFHAGAENQGLVPQYIYAADADYNRLGDRLGGLTKFFYIPFDMTPPSPVPMPEGGNGASTETVDDPTTQFDLQWSNVGIGPDDPDSPVHPTKIPADIDILSEWNSYKIYYGTYNPQAVPLDDDPTSTNGYIYKTFIESGAFRSWTQVDPDTPIDDPSAPDYQSDYQAMTNLGTTSIRLYDLEYDQDYAVVVVSVDKAGNVGNAGVQSWSTNNTIRFALIRGELIEKNLAKTAFPSAKLDNSNAPTAAALYWVASGPTNEQGVYTEVKKDYDLISWDSSRFQENSNNNWQLIDTVRTNWFVDDQGQMRARGQLHFYRASYKDRWRRTNTLGQVQRQLASEEVYSMHNVVLSSGPNFVALHGVPYTNTFRAVFGGVETFPGGASALPDSGSTLVEFFSPGTNALSSEQYFLSSGNEWIQIGGDEVTDVLQPSNFFCRGFSITLPSPLPDAYTNATAMDADLGMPLSAMVWSPILKVPTNGFEQVIQTGSRNGRTTVAVYNLVALTLPVCVHPSEMRLLESGFVNGTRSTSDQIYTIDTTTKTVRQGSTIYCDTEGIWRFLTNDGLVPGGFFAPNDVLVLVSKNDGVGGSWTWRYDPRHFYELPTRTMAP